LRSHWEDNKEHPKTMFFVYPFGTTHLKLAILFIGNLNRVSNRSKSFISYTSFEILFRIPKMERMYYIKLLHISYSVFNKNGYSNKNSNGE
jgi:hypothetical protein